MIKYYCDRCGVEIKKGINKPTNHTYIVFKTPIIQIFHADTFEYDDDFKNEEKSERFHLCARCTDLLDDFFNNKTIKEGEIIDLDND